MPDKTSKKERNDYLSNELDIDKNALKELKKKLSKIEPRSERGVETLFRLLSKNQYTLNTMIDRKSNILISINAIIMSIIIGVVLNQLDRDPHLIYAIILMLTTNLISIAYAVFATRPERNHGDRKTNNLMFYGNFKDMQEEEYLKEITALIYQGDALYNTIAKDTFYLGKVMDKKFNLLRKSFNVFLIGIIISVMAFLLCHLLFGGYFK
ncbi:MAG: hypothetical protein CVU03_10835 [Bacteroidetes bacterium HGW-Bacteroidetes-2]|jgi:hypothetical protein|nr:MAG: hypothetical protein CVU03_10835 [Bacteroidetes bacterium HGW-Bacteroidetes-2]